MSDSKQKAHLPRSLRTLATSIESRRDMTPEMAKSLVEAAGISAEDLMPWADFGHPLRDGYGRKLVYDGGFFEIMVMSWVPGDFSSVHDHGTAQWGAVQAWGHAEHAVFDIIDDRLTTRLRGPILPGEVNAVTHDLIHQMGNVDRPPFCSMHLYGSYDHKGEVTGDSRIFDLFADEVQITTGGVFFCLPDEEISARREGVAADYPTTMRHHAEMLQRVRRFLPFADPAERAEFEALAQKLTASLLAPGDAAWMQNDLAALMDEQGNIRDRAGWDLFWNEINHASRVKSANTQVS